MFVRSVLLLARSIINHMKNFWEEFSKRNNFQDQETLMNVYYALMNLILDELRKNGKIFLPGWGEFYVMNKKAKRIRNINTGQEDILKAMNLVKFKPCDRLKNYVRLMK